MNKLANIKKVHLGQSLTRFFDEQKIDKKEFAERIGCSIAKIYYWLDKRTMDTMELLKWCRVLNLNLIDAVYFKPTVKGSALPMPALVEDFDSLRIGPFFKRQLQASTISAHAFAHKANLSESAIRAAFRAKSFDIDRLIQWGQWLGFSFLEEIYFAKSQSEEPCAR